MSVSQKTAKKIGLVASISVLVGAVIGIGIFFKNDTVFKNNDNNAIGVLISWILAAIIALSTAFSFSEIGFGRKKGAGLAGSAEAMYGNKIGRFLNFNQNFFYYGILNISIAVFTAEAIVNIFITNEARSNFHIGYIFLIAFVLVILFLLFNYFSMKWSARSQIVATFLKFIPLTMVALSGVIYGAMHPEVSLFDQNKINSSSISFNGILNSLPAILFAFDSFLCVGTIKHEMKDTRKQVPLTIVIGMLICIAFYLLVTIGQIMVSSGTADNVFSTIFANNSTAKQAFHILISVFIFISIIGVLNSLILTSLRSFDQFVQNRIVYGYWLFINKNYKQNKAGLYLSFITYGFWFFVIAIPSIIINSDVFVDGISNFPTLFMFAIYGIIVLKGLINRIRKKPNELKIKGFLFFAPISIIGCFLAFGYQFFYLFTIDTFINPFNKLNWGLFFSNPNFITYNYIGCIWFFICLITFLGLPFINDLLIRNKYNKINSVCKQLNIEQLDKSFYEELLIYGKKSNSCLRTMHE